MAGHDDWNERAIALLEEGGNRSTVRRAIVEKLGEQECAVTAAELADQLGRDGRKVGRATVYRALERLRELSLVQRLELGHGGTRYEPARDDHHHHHHLVCDRCGDVVPFADAALEKAIDRVAGKVAFQVAGHDVVLHGACERCAA
jgi:Fur family transcriptional regulator, ferric uptake regulator